MTASSNRFLVQRPPRYAPRSNFEPSVELAHGHFHSPSRRAFRNDQMSVCPACGQDLGLTEWKSDPLRWDLDPPCSEAEWAYLADLPHAPEFMATQACGYMNKICRGCYSARVEVMAKVRSRIRQQGGIEQMRPTQRMRKEYDAAHEFDLVVGRPAPRNDLGVGSERPRGGRSGGAAFDPENGPSGQSSASGSDSDRHRQTSRWQRPSLQVASTCSNASSVSRIGLAIPSEDLPPRPTQGQPEYTACRASAPLI